MSASASAPRPFVPQKDITLPANWERAGEYTVRGTITTADGKNYKVTIRAGSADELEQMMNKIDNKANEVFGGIINTFWMHNTEKLVLKGLKPDLCDFTNADLSETKKGTLAEIPVTHFKDVDGGGGDQPLSQKYRMGHLNQLISEIFKQALETLTPSSSTLAQTSPQTSSTRPTDTSKNQAIITVEHLKTQPSLRTQNGELASSSILPSLHGTAALPRQQIPQAAFRNLSELFAGYALQNPDATLLYGQALIQGQYKGATVTPNILEGLSILQKIAQEGNKVACQFLVNYFSSAQGKAAVSDAPQAAQFYQKIVDQQASASSSPTSQTPSQPAASALPRPAQPQLPPSGSAAASSVSQAPFSQTQIQPPSQPLAPSLQAPVPLPAPAASSQLPPSIQPINDRELLEFLGMPISKIGLSPILPDTIKRDITLEGLEKFGSNTIGDKTLQKFLKGQLETELTDRKALLKYLALQYTSQANDRRKIENKSPDYLIKRYNRLCELKAKKKTKFPKSLEAEFGRLKTALETGFSPELRADVLEIQRALDSLKGKDPHKTGNLHEEYAKYLMRKVEYDTGQQTISPQTAPKINGFIRTLLCVGQMKKLCSQNTLDAKTPVAQLTSLVDNYSKPSSHFTMIYKSQQLSF